MDDSQQIDPRLSEITDSLYRLSAKAVIIENKKILLTLEHDDDWWSLPGGGIDYGESARKALSRELSEELGLDTDSIQTDDTPILITTNAIVDGIPRAILYYQARISDEPVKSTTEVKTFKWCTSEELSSLSLSPSIAKIINNLTRLIDKSSGE